MNQSLIRSVAALAIAIAAAPAFAADQVRDLSSGAGSFVGTTPVLESGTETVTFINLAAGTYDFVLSLSAQSIDGLTVSVNGSPAIMTTVGAVTFASLVGSASPPIVVTLSGTAASIPHYSGELEIADVANGLGDQDVDLSSGSATFVGGSLAGGSDTVTFINLAAGSYSYLFSFSSQDVANLAVDVNGVAAAITTIGGTAFASATGVADAPFVVTVSGDGGPGRRYSGEITLPEPAGDALALVAFGALAIAARQRKR